MMILLNRLKTVFMIVLAMLCVACSSNGMTTTAGSEQIAPTVPNSTVAAYLHNHPDALSNLQADNIKVIQLGDYVRFIMPSQDLFSDFGSTIQSSSYDDLNTIINMIKAVPKVSIEVRAYMFANSSQSLSQRITQRQAKAVQRYLMDNGVNARLIFSFGMGHLNQVTHDTQRMMENYRVEITLKELKTRLPG